MLQGLYIQDQVKQTMSKIGEPLQGLYQHKSTTNPRCLTTRANIKSSELWHKWQGTVTQSYILGLNRKTLSGHCDACPDRQELCVS